MLARFHDLADDGNRLAVVPELLGLGIELDRSPIGVELGLEHARDKHARCFLQFDP